MKIAIAHTAATILFGSVSQARLGAYHIQKSKSSKSKSTKATHDSTSTKSGKSKAGKSLKWEEGYTYGNDSYEKVNEYLGDDVYHDEYKETVQEDNDDINNIDDLVQEDNNIVQTIKCE